MKWDYRAIKHQDNTGEEWLGIHEVYYDQHEAMKAHSERPEPVQASSLENLRWVLTEMLKALDKDVLDEMIEEMPF